MLCFTNNKKQHIYIKHTQHTQSVLLGEYLPACTSKYLKPFWFSSPPTALTHQPIHSQQERAALKIRTYTNDINNSDDKRVRVFFCMHMCGQPTRPATVVPIKTPSKNKDQKKKKQERGTPYIGQGFSSSSPCIYLPSPLTVYCRITPTHAPCISLLFLRVPAAAGLCSISLQ